MNTQIGANSLAPLTNAVNGLALGLGSDLPDNSNGFLSIATPHGVFCSRDGGHTWGPQHVGVRPARRLAWRVGSRLLAWSSGSARESQIESGG